ncbi:hypothetical protein D3C87_1552560 [compost metagenome]
MTGPVIYQHFDGHASIVRTFNAHIYVGLVVFYRYWHPFPPDLSESPGVAKNNSFARIIELHHKAFKKVIAQQAIDLCAQVI